MTKYKMKRYDLPKKKKKYKKGKHKKQKPYKKPFKIGYACVRNEESCIIGWARTMDYFCDKIYPIVDPETSDKTIEILESLPFDINIIYQDRSLGDSDDSKLGDKQRLIMHIAETKFVRENIKLGEWFFTLACDERFHPHDFYRIIKEAKFAAALGFDSISLRRIIEPVTVNVGQLEFLNGKFYYNPEKKKTDGYSVNTFAVDWNCPVAHVRIQKRTKYWEHVDRPHGGYFGRLYKFNSVVPLFHFHRKKNHSIEPTSERDRMGSYGRLIKEFNGMIPLDTITTQMSDWKDMALLTIKENGNIIYPSPIGVEKGDFVKFSNELSDKIHVYQDTYEADRLAFIKKHKL